MVPLPYMVKTTLYLPDSLKARLERIARQEGRSEAEIVRVALEEYTAGRMRPRPRLPLFASGSPDLAERFDEHLEGFGEE